MRRASSTRMHCRQATAPRSADLLHAAFDLRSVVVSGRCARALTADKGGNEINHLFVRELSGESRDLTPGDKAKAEFVGWSADHKYFYVATNERDPKAFDLYRYARRTMRAR